MKKPTCHPSYYNFKISFTVCKDKRINSLMSKIHAGQWNDLDALVHNDQKSTSSDNSLNSYIKAFKMIEDKLICYPILQQYAAGVRSYLNTSIINNEYREKFDEIRRAQKEEKDGRKQKQEARSMKRKLNYETRMLSEAEVLLDTKKTRLKVSDSYTTLSSTSTAAQSPTSNEARGNVSSTSLSCNQATQSPTCNEEPGNVLSPSSSSSQVAQSPASNEAPGNASSPSLSSSQLRRSSVSIQGVKDTIYDAAVKIHDKYTQDTILNETELKSMACGLSCVLDIDAEEVEGSQQMLFSEDTWKSLKRKHEKLRMSPTPLPPEYQAAWNEIASKCEEENDSHGARNLISKMKLGKGFSKIQYRLLDFYEEILYLIDSKKFIMDPNNQSKISERDFAYQVWLPLFDKLFFMKDNLVRIKIGETVLSGSTLSKSALYETYSNIIGFKVDVRILFDFRDEEFDIAAGEACMPNSLTLKIESDQAKLIREGKEMLKILDGVLSDQNVPVYSWMVQISGLDCKFSTVHPTKHGYSVKRTQFKIRMPSTYTILSDKSMTTFLEYLFMFKNSVETTATRLDRKLRTSRTLIRSPERLPPSPADEPTWFTPPRKEKNLSRIPPIYYEGIRC